MKLLLLLLIDLFHAGRFEQCIPAFGSVRLQEGALVQVGSADVDIVFGDVVHCQLLGLRALLSTVLGQLRRRTRVKPRWFEPTLYA